MKNFATFLAVGLPLVAGAAGFSARPAAAQEITVSGGATIASEYVSNGLKQSDGPAIQPWVEAGIGGFYAGIWASNTADRLVGSDYEVDLYLGYRNEVGAFSYDVGYAHYLYRSPTEDCCGEALLTLGYAMTDAFGMGLTFAYDPDAEVMNSSVTAAYALTDRIGLAAEIGTINKGGHDYGSLTGSYALNDSTALSVGYHDASVGNGLGVVAVDFSF